MTSRKDHEARKQKYSRSRRVSTAARLSLQTCTACGKQCFATRHLAKVSADRIFPGAQIRVYMCNGFWHMTSVPAGRMAYYRELNHRRSEHATDQ